MKKYVLLVIILAIIVAGALYFMRYQTPTIRAKSTPSASVSPAAKGATVQAGSSSTAANSQVRVFNISATSFKYTPNVIRVKLGDKVRFNLTAVDKVHGFSLPDFGVSAALAVNQVKSVEFTANKKGTFTFFCNIPCGPGHLDMKGTLIVE